MLSVRSIFFQTEWWRGGGDTRWVESKEKKGDAGILIATFLVS
jgi:hypothetical protein